MRRILEDAVNRRGQDTFSTIRYIIEDSIYRQGLDFHLAEQQPGSPGCFALYDKSKIKIIKENQRNQPKSKKSTGIKEIKLLYIRTDKVLYKIDEHEIGADVNAPLQPNPFTPVFGKVPPYLAGRREIIDSLTFAIENPFGNPDSCSLFVGARGTGKTTLLSALAHEAEEKGWIATNVSAQEGLLEDIIQQTKANASHLIQQKQTRTVSSVGVANLGSISFGNTSEEALNWRSRMTNLLSQLAQTETGLLITVDEVDAQLDELKQLIAAYQMFVRENRKVLLFMAGLPHQVSLLLSGKTTSFLRRATRYNLGPIPTYEVKDAFRQTVMSGNRAIDDSALEEAATAIDGFPYMFQLVGYRAWNQSIDSPIVSVEDIRRGAKLAEEQLKQQIYEATFRDLSEGDKAYLLAMAQDEKETLRADLMDRLQKSSSYISTYKKRLQNEGLIEEPRKGVFVFALPKLREYIIDELVQRDVVV